MKTYMKEKNEILVLTNKTRLRLGLLRELETEAELIHATRFQDIIAEIKWHELDAIVIDMDDEEIDGIGVIQTVNSTCPSVSVLLLCEKNSSTLDQILGILANGSIVFGKVNGKELAIQIRQAIRRARQMRNQLAKTNGAIPMQIDEANENAVEKLVLALMRVNRQAADFQINRDKMSWDYISRIEMFSNDLDQVTEKHALLEANIEEELEN